MEDYWANKLPKNYSYCIVKDEEENLSLRVKEIIDKSTAEVWVDKFSESSQTIWRVLKTYPNAKLRNIFRKDFRCQHYTDKRATGVGPSKNTDCPVKLDVIIKRYIEKSKAKVVDPLVKDYPAIIVLRGKHNHPVLTSEMKNKVKENSTGVEGISSASLSSSSEYPKKVRKRPVIVTEKERSQFHKENSTALEGISTASLSSPSEYPKKVRKRPVIVTEKERSQFQAWIDRIHEGLVTNPEIFIPAFKRMVKNIEQFTSTEAELLSCMRTLGTLSNTKSSDSVIKEPWQPEQTNVSCVQHDVTNCGELIPSEQKLNVQSQSETMAALQELLLNDYVTSMHSQPFK